MCIDSLRLPPWRHAHLVIALVLVACAGDTSAPETDSDTDAAVDTDTDDGVDEGPCPWPSNPDREALGDPDVSTIGPEVGNPVPRLESRDQFGRDFDLFDFHEADRPVVIQLVYLDQREVPVELAKLTADMPSTFDDGPLARLPDAIADCDLWLIRVVVLGMSGATPTYEGLQWWDRQYPQPGAPLVFDESAIFWRYVGRFWSSTPATAEIPEFIVVDPATMTVTADPEGSLDNLADVLAATE